MIAALLIAAPAAASGPDAWSKFDGEVRAACITASKFRNAQTSSVIGFDDRVGKVALLVSGIWPQPHMKGARGTMLCLYDKRGRDAFVDEAKGWSAVDDRR
ncbi:MAG: hypothetical protein B7Y45_04355 [Sphingomonas sp. 28-66-16]|nr:MAG: hypothetical protein B7Y45_04355 [Sphingomonas sp. 28-66-16]